MILDESYTLANGVHIPKLGLGTWFIDEKAAPAAVNEAVALGYRHIDTAQAYQNERGVGEGVRNCGIARDALFVTSKLAAEEKTYEGAVALIDGSLKTMQLDYIDLMIIHSPQPWQKFGDADRYEEGNRQAWRALEDAYQAGKVRAIGVSNFQQADLDNLLEACTVAPMVNQVLAHISNMPTELIDYCRSKNVVVEAYSPVGHGELFKNSAIAHMADKYSVSIPQLCIRYLLQKDLLPLPKTANPAHMQNNADVDFVINEADMQTLTTMKRIENYGDASVFPVYSGK